MTGEPLVLPVCSAIKKLTSLIKREKSCDAQVHICSVSKRSETMTIRVCSEMKAVHAQLAKAERRSASQMAVILLEEALEARAVKKG